MKRYCLRVVKVAALVLFGAAAVSALPSFLSSGDRRDSTDPFALHDIESPDGSIKASFIALGATIQSLYVKDRYGSAILLPRPDAAETSRSCRKHRDVVLGYDDTGKYMTDPNHPYFGAVVGRYANRIKNGEPCSLHRVVIVDLSPESRVHDSADSRRAVGRKRSLSHHRQRAQRQVDQPDPLARRHR